MTPIRPTATCLALLLAVAGGAVLPARADDDPAALKRQLDALQGSIAGGREKAEKLKKQAAEQADQLARLRAEMQAAGRAVQSHEAAVTHLEEERAGLRDEIAVKRASLAARRGQLGVTLAALERIALRPPAALLVSRGDPNDMVRSGLLIRTAIPQIEDRAAALRGELDELAALDMQLAGNKRDLEAAGAALVEEQGRLAALVDRKNALFEATKAEQEAAATRVEQLARKARTLGDLLDALMRRGEMQAAEPLLPPQRGGAAASGVGTAAATPVPPPAPPPAGPAVSEARGRLTPPAQGQLVIAFGDHNSFGATAHGVTWRVRPGSSVLAPWDGRVVFAGPFRHFGRILIIDHGEGYHSLIAGLARIDARAGQWVLAGEPVGAAGVGTAGNALTRSAGNGNETSAGTDAGGDTGGGGPSVGSGSRTEGPTVYVEFRRNGQPINPLPWLAASLDRTHG